MSDFIDMFMEYTEGSDSPRLFRLWSAISIMAGALERRVWIRVNRRHSYPNLFVLLVAPPGIGKGIIEEVRALWRKTCQKGTKIPAFHVAPSSMTKASLIDSLAAAKVIHTPKNSAPVVYHSLLVAAEEFSVLLPAYDMEYIGVLNEIWGNVEQYEERRRHGPAKETRIEKPTLNMLGGAQPAFLASLFPEDAWNTGLARRLVMIYSTDTPNHSIFYEPDIDEALGEDLVTRLGRVASLYGQMQWEEAAMNAIARWDESGKPGMGGAPVPEHTKLQHYNKSRRYFAFKLCMIASCARSDEMIIREEDVDRALGWMLEAERYMPDIFRAMLGRSDRDVLDEMYTYVLMRSGSERRAVPVEDIRRFLLERVPHDKVESLIGAAEKATLIDRVAGTGTEERPAKYVPKARFNYAPE